MYPDGCKPSGGEAVVPNLTAVKSPLDHSGRSLTAVMPRADHIAAHPQKLRKASAKGHFLAFKHRRLLSHMTFVCRPVSA